MNCVRPEPVQLTEKPAPFDTSSFHITDVDDAAPAEALDMDHSASKASFVWSLLLKLVKVKDISSMRLSLPANLLEPHSNLEFWNYNDRPDFFISMAEPADPVERMLHVLRWFLCKDTKWRHKSPEIKKPYNPVLGEVFKCEWLTSDAITPTFFHGSSKAQPVGANAIRVGCLTEQLVHNPSVSAFYYECKERGGIVARGVDHISARFTGTAIKIGAGEHNCGVFVTLGRWNEEYQLTYPWASVGGWLSGSPYITVSENTTVTCEKSGLKCIFSYKPEPFFGSPKFAVEGKIFRLTEKLRSVEKISDIPDAEVLATIWGQWNGKVYAKLKVTGYEGLLFDLQESETAKKVTKPVEQMAENESQRVWRHVSEAIESKQYGEATKLKREIEDAQRKKRAGISGDFQSHFFEFRCAVLAGSSVESGDRGKPYLREGVCVFEKDFFPLEPAVSPPTDDVALIAQQVVKVVQNLARDANVLLDSTASRLEKRRALDHIRAESTNRSLIPKQTSSIFAALANPLLRCFSEPVEACRESSIGIVDALVSKSDDLLSVLPHLIPAISSRLAQPDIVEPSEEIRLLLVRLLLAIVEKTKQVFGPGVDETVKILNKTLTDPFPEVRKESCSLIIALSNHTPQTLTLHCSPLAKSLTPSLQHRHAAVRIQSLKALQALAIVDASALDDMSDTLRTLSLDKSTSVREALYNSTYTWLIKMPDRYSIGYKVLPYLLAGLADEAPNLKHSCFSKLDDIGILYENEWPDRVKSDMDYNEAVGIDRPRVGIRHLARDNTQKVVNKILEGLTDWNVDVRCKSAQMLATFLPLTEKNITGYVGTLLPAIYKVLAGDESIVINELRVAAEFLGKYVDPDLYLNVLLSHSTLNHDSPELFSIGCLRTLNAILRGTPASALDTRHRVSIANALRDMELMKTENMAVVLEAAVVTNVLCSKMAIAADDIKIESEGFTLFGVLIALASVRGNEMIPAWMEAMSKTDMAFDEFSKAHHLGSVDELYPMYFQSFLSILTDQAESWTRFSTGELRIFNTFLVRSGKTVGIHLEGVVRVIAQNITEHRDLEVRQSILETLLQLLRQRGNPLDSSNVLCQNADDIINKIVLPSAVWKPGRRTSITRGLAMEILSVLLESGPRDLKEFAGFIPKSALATYVGEKHAYIPVTLACLDEDEVEIRSVAVKALDAFLYGCVQCGIVFRAQNFKSIYPELWKRLDDSSDIVRIAACKAITRFALALECFHSQHPIDLSSGLGYVDADGTYIECRLDDVHWVEMIKGATIHVDDAIVEVQNAAFEALLSICKPAPPPVVDEQLKIARERFKNVNYLDNVRDSVLAVLNK
ncbi:HEAT repeat-containing protein 2 [Entophlyctis luteolus]|nr:HEAT repeat-containing protein 2 [Entophlyctis luteolus]